MSHCHSKEAIEALVTVSSSCGSQLRYHNARVCQCSNNTEMMNCDV